MPNDLGLDIAGDIAPDNGDVLRATRPPPGEKAAHLRRLGDGLQSERGAPPRRQDFLSRPDRCPRVGADMQHDELGFRQRGSGGFGRLEAFDCPPRLGKEREDDGAHDSLLFIRPSCPTAPRRRPARLC
jgi:hypothetical protein